MMLLRSAWGLLLTLAMAAGWAQVPAGPVAYWPFEGEGAASGADISGHGHTLSLQGVGRETGAVGTALRFGGADSLVQAPLADDLQSPDAVTLEAWARPDVIPPGSEGLGLVNLGNVLLRITRATPSFHVFTDRWGPVLADGEVRPGQWYHLVGTYDGSEMRIYVNGQLAGACERTGRIAPCDRPLQLGRQANPFIGLIDEARVYLRRLSEDEVTAAYAAGVSRLNPGIAPGRLKRPDESWVEALWRVPEPPAPLADLAGGPVPERRPGEDHDSLCGVSVGIPKPVAARRAGREDTADHAWRLARELGCSWLQVWPPPGPSEDWEALVRMLALGRPPGVKLAVPLSMYPKAMQAAWARLAPQAAVIDAVIVNNGVPTNPWEPLTSWRFTGTQAEWVSACAAARGLVPSATKVILARVPLLGEGALDRMGDLAAALSGRAEVLCVSLPDVATPERIVAGPLRQALAIARQHGLELWLDAAAGATVPDTTRTAGMLRLLLLCQAQGTRLIWWPGSHDPSGRAQPPTDPTPQFAALQAWNRMMSPPITPLSLLEGDTHVLRWQDRTGQAYVAWWQADNAVETIGSTDLELPPGAVIVDPLHARLLLPKAGTRLPLCRWPLLARSGGH